MAPSPKTKTLGKDIRSFFGGNRHSQPASGRKADVITISDNDESTSEWKQLSAPHKPEPMTKKPSNGDAKDTQRHGIRSSPKTSNHTHVQKPKTERVMESSDDELPQQPKRITSLKRKKPAVLLSSDSEVEEKKISPPKKKLAVPVPSSSKPVAGGTMATQARPKAPKATSSKVPPKRAKKDEDYSIHSESDPGDDDDDDDDADDLVPKSGTRKSKASIKAPKKNLSTSRRTSRQDGDEKEKAKESKEAPKNVSNKPANWAAAKAARLAGPSAPGSKEIPEPVSPDCLAGLSFVFTGELSSLSREEAVDLAKKYGGRVVGQPSSVTSFVVLGMDAGPAKLKAIEKHKLKTLDEDGFIELIRTRKGPGGINGAPLDAKAKKKLEKEQEAIRQGAREMELMEKKAGKEKDKIVKGPKAVDISSQLWTTRYAPQRIKDICGNKGQVEKLQQWLRDWPQSLKCGFKKPGKNAMNVFRAVLITGSPGIGKTTSAHLCAMLEGLTPIELNASDTRSRKLIENAMNINNKSLDGWIGKGEGSNTTGITITDRACLIMDEVDGMSAGDRGGVNALNALIRKTKIPIICIANDRGAQKLKPLMSSTFSLPFRKPEAAAIRSRILSVAYREKMKIPANVIDQLIAGAQSDIRQVLNMLSTWRLSSDTMTFDESKNLAKANEKYMIMTPFDITQKVLGPYMFSPTSRSSLNDKMELYFQDHSFVPLFIQENYLKTQPARLRNEEGPEKIMRQLHLMDCAASSISDGDLVDALIHGPEQHWSLMPLHAICSTVRPAHFLYGAGSGYGGPNAMSFPQWLGQNSKQNKLTRQLGEVQIRMRLKASGNRNEIRQSYLPAMFPHIVRPLMDVGANAIEEVIERMDEYFLSREDWDTVVELGVGEKKGDVVLKKISPATKASFTRKYNGMDHPVPYHKAQDLGRPPKKIGGGAIPDLEEAFDADDDIVEDASDDEKKRDAPDDISNDKLIQVAKKKTKKPRVKAKAQ